MQYALRLRCLARVCRLLHSEGRMRKRLAIKSRRPSCNIGILEPLLESARNFGGQFAVLYSVVVTKSAWVSFCIGLPTKFDYPKGSLPVYACRSYTHLHGDGLMRIITHNLKVLGLPPIYTPANLSVDLQRRKLPGFPLQLHLQRIDVI